MKLIILILICATVLGAQFEKGYVTSGKISAHKIYRQDIKLNNNFTEIPKIVLSVIGYNSNHNTLDFFSRVTEVTQEGFQLQIISDSEINEMQFYYLATDHQDVQTICNNIEVQKDQIDIKFNKAFEKEQPQVAAFLTGIHRKNQDDIILEIKLIEKNQVHLTTQSKAESSIGLCLLIGPQDLFIRKELPIMQISQGLPNTCFYGISSLSGMADNGIVLSLNQEFVKNSFEIGLTLVEINSNHITLQEENNDNSTVSFDDFVDKLTPQEFLGKMNIIEIEGQVKINSIQITQEELNQESQMNSISFIYPEQKNQLYIEDEEQSLQQQNQENVQEIITISESWLQHDLSVVDQSQTTLNSNQDQVNEGQQILTNLIKPQDYNTNSIEYENFQPFKRQPVNIAIVDSTQSIIEENQKQTQNNQDFISDNSTQNYDLENKIENQIEQQIDSVQEQIVVENLQEQIMEMQEEMQNQLTSQSHVPSELNPFKIIEQQQFIVEQQKQLVEQQQQIILQYQRMLEHKVKILPETQLDDDKQENNEQQISLDEDSQKVSLQSTLIINNNTGQNLQTDLDEQNREVPQTQDQLQQNIQDQKYIFQDFPRLSLENQSDFKKDLESIDRNKKRKDDIDEQKATKILKEITKDLQNDEKLEDKINQLEDGLNEVLQIKSQNEVEQNLSGITSNKRVEFSNTQNNFDKTSSFNFKDSSNQVVNISLEEISEAIFPQEYEMEQAYFDWSMNQGLIKNRNDQQINLELINQSTLSTQQSQEELQKQIEEFLELDYNDSHFSDPLFDDFHSFFSVNQQVKKNLRKRKVLNV
ncbi:unnamed protein product [Paramecium sonneborni]|uniref:H-type lectin domain-containing protein n=1 Tax=Paramecium sonneborni TaxID=65129 RepID=A0A8S1LC19_9CILI|nr:unnamed protein product [Paramecium sonneborni]